MSIPCQFKTGQFERIETGRCTHDTITQSLEFDDVWSQNTPLVPLDGRRIVLNEKESIGVDHEIDLALTSD